MARQARLALAGYPHHLMLRGNNRGRIFEDDADHRRYRELLRDASRAYNIAIHAYALMPNHVHLLVTPRQGERLSRFMQALGRNYVGWFNQRHGRTGTLWEGRFRSSVVEAEAWLLACIRYIELNPVRAQLAASAAEYPWSSAGHHLGRGADALVTDHALYWALGNTPFEREARYRAFLEEATGAADLVRLNASLTKGRPLGGAAFVARLEEQFGVSLAPRPRGRPRKG